MESNNPCDLSSSMFLSSCSPSVMFPCATLKSICASEVSRKPFFVSDRQEVEPVLNGFRMDHNRSGLYRDLAMGNTFSKNSEEHADVCKKCTLTRRLTVPCLETIEDLMQKCDDLNLEFNDYVAEIPYEVDMICDHSVEEGITWYYVKWKNYTSDSNTWEPEYHLDNCKEIIEYYHAIRKPNPILNDQVLQFFVRDLISRKPCDMLSLVKTCAICLDSSEEYVKSLNLTVNQMKQKVRDIVSFPHGRLKYIKRKLLSVMQFAEQRKHVLLNLKEWEMDINQENESAYIAVENDVDLEKAPESFQFIHDYMYTSVEITQEPVAFCQCDNCYDNKNSCCPKDSDGPFAYTKRKRLVLLPGYPIYECNKYCKCSNECINRVVQHGQKVKVCIFRTSNGCGWGLKTLEPIEKDQFVCEYLGEVITSEMAEARGLVYDYIGRSYLFDLDYGVEDCLYTVDAGHLGNAAHFINHSCDPNLHVFAVWINHADPNLPRLAFFAKRKIKRGEELTFDYKMIQKDKYESSSDLPDDKRILCQCNAKKCRKYLF